MGRCRPLQHLQRVLAGMTPGRISIARPAASPPLRQSACYPLSSSPSGSLLHADQGSFRDCTHVCRDSKARTKRKGEELCDCVCAGFTLLTPHVVLQSWTSNNSKPVTDHARPLLHRWSSARTLSTSYYIFENANTPTLCCKRFARFNTSLQESKNHPRPIPLRWYEGLRPSFALIQLLVRPGLPHVLY